MKRSMIRLYRKHLYITWVQIVYLFFLFLFICVVYFPFFKCKILLIWLEVSLSSFSKSRFSFILFALACLVFSFPLEIMFSISSDETDWGCLKKNYFGIFGKLIVIHLR